MRFVQGRDGPAIALGNDPPVNFCKPAVDPLLSSAAKVSRGALPKRHLVYFDIANPRGRAAHATGAAGPAASLSVGDGRVEKVSAADHGRFTRVVVNTSAAATADQGRVFPNPDRLIVG